MVICEFCGKTIKNRIFQKHINVLQTPKIHVFCSKKCKHLWCNKIRDEWKRTATIVEKC